MKKLLLSALLAIIAVNASAQTQCTATTQKGAQCSRKATKDQQFCKQHNPIAIKCAGTTKAGKPCQMQPKKTGIYCQVHSK